MKSLTTEQKNYIQVNYTKASTPEMAKAINCSRWTVWSYLKKLGVKAYQGRRVQRKPLHLTRIRSASDFELIINGAVREVIRNHESASDYTMIKKIHEKYSAEIVRAVDFQIVKIVPAKFPPITAEELVDAGKPLLTFVKSEREAPAIYSNGSHYGIANSLKIAK